MNNQKLAALSDFVCGSILSLEVLPHHLSLLLDAEEPEEDTKTRKGAGATGWKGLEA